MPENNEIRLVIQDKDNVTVPRSEYNDLMAAKLAIEILGNSMGKYGVNSTVADTILARFGYHRPNDPEAADA